MSRLIVKNIPKHASESRIKSLFEKFGEVTDTRIIFSKDNTKNRRFCFVGFKEQEGAKKAQEQLNNTFMDTSKLLVDFAKTKDEITDRRKEKKAGKRKENGNEEGLPQKKDRKDVMSKKKQEKFADFLNTMQSTKNKVAIRQYIVPDENENQGNQESQNGKKEERKFEEVTKEIGVDEKRLMVLNIPFNLKPDEFRAVFSRYGTLTECTLPRDTTNTQLKGFGFVSYEDKADAMKAFLELENKIEFGRILHLKPALKSKKSIFEEDPSLSERSSFKKLQKKKLMERLDDDSSWNSLFLNPNTVADIISERFNIRKLKQSEIYSKEIGGMAVKQAKIETEIINETKDWLEKHGVNMRVFAGTRPREVRRSRVTIIVKNLPSKFKESKLKELFSNYGKVNDFLLPDTKSIALVRFENEQHAQNAFKLLGNYTFAGSPLFLEWAPENILAESDTKETKKPEQNESKEEEEWKDAKIKTVFVKNLAFETTEESLKEFMSTRGVGGYKVVKIAKKEGNLSQGFGFVEFMDFEGAENFIKKCQNELLDGHRLDLSWSKPKKEKETKKLLVKRNHGESENSTKLSVKNIPFEATRQDLKELFNAYGELKSLRLPKKMKGGHKGYAFVEFASNEEAMNAFEALASTHLYGRKLVIEWAEE